MQGQGCSSSALCSLFVVRHNRGSFRLTGLLDVGSVQVGPVRVRRADDDEQQ